MSTPPRWLGPAAFALAITTGVVLLVARFGVFFGRFTTHLIGHHGDVLLQHLHVAWQWQALASGELAASLRLPTMHPYQSGLAFGESLAGVAWLFFPAHLLGGDAAGYNAAVLGSFVLVALGVGWLTWELLRSPSASLAAGLLAPFVEWRIFHLTSLNVSSCYFALGALALLVRWSRRPTWPALLGATLLAHLQFASASQSGISLLYLSLVWLPVVWLGQRCPLRRSVLAQLAGAAALFVALGVPWLRFHTEAWEAGTGLMRGQSLEIYRRAWPDLLRQLSLWTWFAPASGLGLVGWLAHRRLGLRERPLLGWQLLGLALGAALLTAIATGAYYHEGATIRPLPGLLALRYFPLLGSLRVAERVAVLVPLLVAVLAGGALGLLVEWLAARLFWARVRARWPQLAWLGALGLLAPLGLSLTWPDLRPGMLAPLAQRPADLALARRLAELPPDAVIAQLPLALGHQDGSRVDERVLVHGRRQVGGFASIVPQVFWEARRVLLGWPEEGHAVLEALGVTHLVVPAEETGRLAGDARYRLLDQIAGQRLVAVVPSLAHAADADADADAAAQLAPRAPPGSRLRTSGPSRAVAGQHVTIAQWDDGPPSPFLAGHWRGRARWRAPEGDTWQTASYSFLPGFAGLDEPVRHLVPVPGQPGRWELTISAPWSAHLALEVVAGQVTTADQPIRAGALTLDGASLEPTTRAGATLTLPLRVTAGPGPLWLATSTTPVPDRRGEAVLVWTWRDERGAASHGRGWPYRATHLLPHDLAPGESVLVPGRFEAPARPGRYLLGARVEAFEIPGNAMPWQPLGTVLVR